MQSTSWPRLRKLSHRWEPIKPAPPVTRYLAIAASYGVVGKTQFAHIVRVVNVSAVEYHRLGQQVFHSFEVGAAKFVPLGQDEQRRGAMQRIIVPVSILDPVSEN